MTQLMHCIIAVVLFNLTFHLVLKKTPFMQEKIRKETLELLRKYF